VLRRTFGSKWEEATGSWIKLHDELQNSYIKYYYSERIKNDEMFHTSRKQEMRTKLWMESLKEGDTWKT
jgi:hypothetical protein